MAIVLALVGIAVYLRFEANLNETFDRGLRSRAEDLSALIQQRDGALTARGGNALLERGESFAQILAADGTVLDRSRLLPGGSLLTPSQSARAAGDTFIFERANPFETAEPARLLATPVTARGRRLIAVVGAGADDRDSQLSSLALLLAISGPIALLLASLAGYGVASGALRPVEAMRRSADEITDDAPGARLPVGAADDEIARLGTTLNRMLGRLERAVERERAFVADAGHELRTPLAILKTEVELARRGERSAGELRAALASAEEEIDRLAELSGALLLIARADGGDLPLALGAVETAALLEGVAIRFAARLRASTRALVVDAGRPVTLTADLRRLEQALDNLVENALRHGAGTVALTATADGATLTIDVHDEGPGFPPDFIATAFERFTRADRARARGGTGLGLAIVQAIARAHGGEAHAGNDPGGGARVSIQLPLMPAPSQNRPPGQATPA